MKRSSPSFVLLGDVVSKLVVFIFRATVTAECESYRPHFIGWKLEDREDFKTLGVLIGQAIVVVHTIRQV
jgi:hypothetical protein